MPVEYPQVMMAIKDWVGKNKTGPASSVETEGQPAIKKRSFAELIAAGFADLVSLAISGGLALGTGGSEGFNKFFDGLSPALKEPLSALKETFNGLTTTSGGDSIIPSSFQSAWTGFKDVFVNPVATTFSEFSDGLSVTSNELAVLNSTLASDQPELASAFSSNASRLGLGLKETWLDIKSYSDGFTLGTSDFTLTDAFSAANDSSTKFLETYVGITKAPSVGDLAGTLVETELHDNMAAAISVEQVKRQELLDKVTVLNATTVGATTGTPWIQLSDDWTIVPATTSTPLYVDPDTGSETWTVVPATTSSPFLASYWTPKPADATQTPEYVAWLASVDAIEAATTASHARMIADQNNAKVYIRDQQVLDSIGNVSSTMTTLQDPVQQALYASTVKPDVLDTAVKLTQKTRGVYTASVEPLP